LIIRIFVVLVTYFITAVISKFFRKRKIAPRTIIFSISANQIWKDSTPGDLKSILSETRFAQYFSIENSIWQVRSLNFNRYFRNEIVFDAARYILINCLTWSLFLRILVDSITSVCYKDFDTNKTSTQSLIEELIDGFTWKQFFGSQHSQIELITTLSSGLKLPICFREEYAKQTHRIMLWYSNNSFQITNRHATVKTQHPLANFSKEIDLNLVWSSSQKRELESLDLGACQIIGPIHFQKHYDLSVAKEKQSKELRVAFFDVIPIQHLQLGNFYSSKACRNNLLSTVELLSTVCRSENMNLTFVLKPKREYKLKYHDRAYIELCTSLAETKKIIVEEAQVNLYSFLSGVDLVLGVPFTSPVQLAHHLGIKAAYVSFESSEWNVSKNLDGIEVLFDLNELELFIREFFIRSGFQKLV